MTVWIFLITKAIAESIIFGEVLVGKLKSKKKRVQRRVARDFLLLVIIDKIACITAYHKFIILIGHRVAHILLTQSRNHNRHTTSPFSYSIQSNSSFSRITNIDNNLFDKCLVKC